MSNTFVNRLPAAECTFECAPVSYFIFSATGEILNVNAAGCSLLGLEKVELVGKGVCKAFSFLDEQAILDHIGNACSSSAVLVDEFTFMDGEDERVVRVRSRSSCDEDGPESCFSVVIDISRHKKIEDALLESEFRLKKAQEVAGLGSWDLDVSSGVASCSEHFFKLFGGPPQGTSTLETFYTFVHEDDIAMVQRESVRSIRSGEPLNMEFRFRHKDGSIRHAHAVGELYKRESGGMRLVGSMQDITNRKQTEEALRDSEQKYRGLFDGAGDAIFVYEVGGRLLDVNRVACERLGYSREELISMAPGDFEHPDSRGNMDSIGQHLQESDQYIGETVHITRDGAAIPVEISARAVLYQDKPTVLCIARDVRVRKALEEELRVARKEAVEASESKSKFLANMSHEMRTPLSGILGLTELTLATELNEDQRINLKMVRDSGRNLLTIINDILDLTKIEAGKLDLVQEEFDLDRVLSSTVQLFNIEAKSKGLDLSFFKTLETPQTLIGDPVRLRQVLANLVGNAVKFTEQGRVEVAVRSKPVFSEVNCDRPQVELQFEVRDTGCGIDEENLASIFDSFRQADESYSRRYQGTGLGLAICKRLVELMGGTIEVSSEVGRGSTFVFTVRTETIPTLDYADSTEKICSVGLPSLNILLAEDNEVNQFFVKRLLEMDGHSLTSVLNGNLALEELRRNRYDLVLMDIQMPEMDGVQAARLIRAGAGGVLDPEVPIIAITAYAMKGDRDRFLAAGMNDYISKPFDHKELGRVISRVMLMQK